MSRKTKAKRLPAPLVSAVLSVVFTVLGALLFRGIGYKYVLLAAGAGILWLLWSGELKRLWNLPSLLLLGYAAFSMLTIFWALSGKFFLRRYAITFTAVFFFLYAVLRGSKSAGFTRRAMGICAGISTTYAVLAVEEASIKLFRPLTERLIGEGMALGGYGGARLNGAFGNPNIEASFYAIGIIFCVALICGSEQKRGRALWMVALSCNAFALLLSASVGAIACFAVAVVVYLIFAGKGRGAALPRMFGGAICALAGAVVVSRFFARFPAILPLMLLLCAAASAALELGFGTRLSDKLAANEKVVFGVLIGAAVLAAAYLAIGLNLSAPYTNTQGGWLIRNVRLSPGEHTLHVEASAEQLVSINSQSNAQAITSGSDQLFYDVASEVTFTVPEDSSVCSFGFYCRERSTIYSATIDGGKRIVLTYRILPGFLAARLVNPTGSNSFRQRMAYVQDGLRLFRLSPVVGLGDGAFETAFSMVQDYEYETNHTHNQYIETLLESGVIGFALFFGALVTLAVALWKARKRMLGSEYRWIYPALCAEFAMSALQMLWDMSMAVTVFTCMIYTLYGLIVATCAAPLPTKKADNAQTGTGAKTKKASVKPAGDIGIRIACSALPLLFVVSVGCNIYARLLCDGSSGSLDEFMSRLSRAAKMDLYEHNDEKLSFVLTAMDDDKDGVYREQADEYARQLSKAQSNTIPYSLVVYYLNTRQLESAIEEAKAAARYSASSSKVWNNCIDALKQAFIDSGMFSPLLEDDGTLMRGLMEYYDMLQRRDAASLKPIALNENSIAFFEKIKALNACEGDYGAMYVLLTAAGQPEE